MPCACMHSRRGSWPVPAAKYEADAGSSRAWGFCSGTCIPRSKLLECSRLFSSRILHHCDHEKMGEIGWLVCHEVAWPGLGLVRSVQQLSLRHFLFTLSVVVANLVNAWHFERGVLLCAWRVGYFFGLPGLFGFDVLNAAVPCGCIHHT